LITTIVRSLRLLLLGLWLGAAVFFGAAVAPTVFGVLRGAQLPNANELAGLMITRILATINRGGFEISLFLIVTGYFLSKKESRLMRFAEMISLAIMAIMTGVSHWIISARMLALRAAMQAPIDQIASSDPRRLAFDALHGYSVTAMGIAIVAGLVAFLIIARPKALARPIRAESSQ
jgi:Domain of unknown function (DUF4149)